MAQPKVFVTGVTGYIGGDAFDTIYKAHPYWDYRCLVRNSDKGAQVGSKYGTVKMVYGTLEDVSVLESAARDADITLNLANADHGDAAIAILSGIKAHPSSSPGRLIHVSGTGVLCYPDLERKTFGESATKVWDDLKDIDEIKNDIPDFAPHRKVDKLIMDSGLKTATVCPPTIYGVGRGPGNQRSIQLPDLARGFLLRKKGFYVGKGETHWTHVHLHDLSRLFLLLAEDAVNGGGRATWGIESYFFCENGDHVWGNISQEMAKKAKKLEMLESADADSISATEADEIRQYGSLLWGCNSRGTASRARKELGWKPVEESMIDSIEECLKIEKGSID